MRRNGFPGSREPILDPLETIECRDAILTPDGGEPDWPDTDVIIGNPPFLGGKLLISNLGEEYVSTLFRVYEGRVPREADLVCYWFVKAGDRLGGKAAKRVGLVATNSIRGGANRRALEGATGRAVIFNAWSDEPWVIDGAAVRVSLVCFSANGRTETDRHLDGETVDEIYTDLTARRGEAGLDLTKAQRLARNAGVAFMGDTKGGPFDVPGDLARQWLREPANPNARPNSDVLKTVDQRDGNHAAIRRQVDRRFRVDDGGGRRRPVRGSVPTHSRTRPPNAAEKPDRRTSSPVVAASSTEAGTSRGAWRVATVHRDATGRQASTVRLA